MLADVARADRAEERVRNCMGENIAIGMSLQPARVRDFNSADDQLSIFGQTMHVVTDSASNHF
jgi:hypothetical protein